MRPVIRVAGAEQGPETRPALLFHTKARMLATLLLRAGAAASRAWSPDQSRRLPPRRFRKCLPNLPAPRLRTWVTRTWRALTARVEFRDKPGLVLSTHDEPTHRGPERTEPHPLRPTQRDLDQPGTGAVDESGAWPVVNSAEGADSERTTQLASVQGTSRCHRLARDRGVKCPPHANIDRRGTHRDARGSSTGAERRHEGAAGSIDADRERPLVDHDRSSGKPQTHPERVFNQIGCLSQPGPLLTLVGAGHQHREDLLLVLAPEGTRVAGQQLPVASLEVCGVIHVTVPAAGFRRDIATRALACNRAASAASTSPPADVSR